MLLDMIIYDVVYIIYTLLWNRLPRYEDMLVMIASLIRKNAVGISQRARSYLPGEMEVRICDTPLHFINYILYEDLEAS